MIRIGQKLNIWMLPAYSSKTRDLYASANTGKSAPGITSGSKVYQVQNGDTLWDISKATDVTIEQLKRLNNLRSNTIQPGQELVLDTK